MDIRSQFQSAREVIGATRKEMEKDGLDLLEQVLVLMLGGVLGGQALSIAEATYPILIELALYLILIVVGIFTLGVIHFIVSYHRVLNVN